jgi:hypothetical protein
LETNFGSWNDRKKVSSGHRFGWLSSVLEFLRTYSTVVLSSGRAIHNLARQAKLIAKPISVMQIVDIDFGVAPGLLVAASTNEGARSAAADGGS